MSAQLEFYERDAAKKLRQKHLEAYIGLGWHLVPLNGKKGGEGWSKKENAVTTVENLNRLPGNLGLLHEFSGTMALDVDDLELAAEWLAEHGINVYELLDASDAVQIVSGRENRAKLLYKVSEPLTKKQINRKDLGLPLDPDPEKSAVIDFRCKGCQDVLPPSINPKTKRPYKWAGDFLNLPTIPDALLKLWKSLLPSSEPRTEAKPRMGLTDDQIREKLARNDPNMSGGDWSTVGAGIHHETNGSESGLRIWDAWSSTATRDDCNGKKLYKGLAKLRARWTRFDANDPNGATIAALDRLAEDRSAAPYDDVTNEPAPVEKPKQGKIPKNHHLTTDLANAQRIKKHVKNELCFAAGKALIWVGTHWANDERLAYATAWKLSDIIRQEADQFAKKEVSSEDERKQNAEIAEALRKWAKKSEMKTTVDAAYNALRKLLAVEPSKFDSDDNLLNCRNGTIDLRTGVLKPHDLNDYITKLIPVDYLPDAKAPRFEQFVSEIYGEEGQVAKPVSRFIQRWFGYAATGLVREQKLAVHYGHGANGKSTLVDAISGVLGEYATTAAPGLLTAARGERHPTEIAALRGQRLVTAHESDDGADLREGFIKQVTGGDSLQGRFMRQDFFEFRPTHKLQLLTNHKPVVKGQDFGIWRRVLLVPYSVQFGDQDSVDSRRAHRLRDAKLAEALLNEREGILAWIVRGAVDWYQQGLNPPDVVLAAVEEYRSEQDRVAQFVIERCDLGPNKSCELTGEIYRTYQVWCQQAGYSPLQRPRFTSELERVVPGFRKEKRKVKGSGSHRADVTIIHGVQLYLGDADETRACA